MFILMYFRVPSTNKCKTTTVIQPGVFLLIFNCSWMHFLEYLWVFCIYIFSEYMYLVEFNYNANTLVYYWMLVTHFEGICNFSWGKQILLQGLHAYSDNTIFLFVCKFYPTKNTQLCTHWATHLQKHTARKLQYCIKQEQFTSEMYWKQIFLFHFFVYTFIFIFIRHMYPSITNLFEHILKYLT